MMCKISILPNCQPFGWQNFCRRIVPVQLRLMRVSTFAVPARAARGQSTLIPAVTVLPLMILRFRTPPAFPSLRAVILQRVAIPLGPKITGATFRTSMEPRSNFLALFPFFMLVVRIPLHSRHRRRRHLRHQLVIPQPSQMIPTASAIPTRLAESHSGIAVVLTSTL